MAINPSPRSHPSIDQHSGWRGAIISGGEHSHSTGLSGEDREEPAAASSRKDGSLASVRSVQEKHRAELGPRPLRSTGHGPRGPSSFGNGPKRANQICASSVHGPKAQRNPRARTKNRGPGPSISKMSHSSLLVLRDVKSRLRAIKLQLNAHLAKKKPKCSQQAAFGCVCVFVTGKFLGPTGHGPHGPPQCGARSITGQPAAKSPRATGHTDHRRAGRGPKRANRKPFHHGPARRPEFGPIAGRSYF